MLLLDTQALVWSRAGDLRLGTGAKEGIERAVQDGEAGVSAITFWEVAMLHQKGRMALLSDVSSWRANLLEQGLVEIPVDGDIGIRASGLADFHADPADRIIVATALAGHRLLTSDARILSWSGNLDRLDARK